MKNRNLKQLIVLLTPVLSLPLVQTSLAKDKEKGGRPHGPEEVFEAMDADDNGSITARELGESRRFRNSPKGAVAKIFKEKDLNGDGGISQHEFRKTFGANDGGKGRKGKGPGKGGKGKGGKSGKGGKGKG